MPDPDEILDIGWRARTTPSGIRVIELDYIADPVKRDPKWVTETRALYPNDRAFRREFMRDWSAAAGEPYYPEFAAQGGRDRFVRAAPGLIDASIIRGWDFGFRRPAIVFLQRDSKGRVWFLREFMPENVSTATFAEVVLYLSGQRSLMQLPAEALDWVSRLHADPRYPDPPWFGSPGAVPLRFVDFAGHEANMVSATVEGEHEERYHTDVLASKGILLNSHYIHVKAREQIMRRLLMPMEDGSPVALFDPACDLLIRGMEGGFSYAKETKMDPHPEKPYKDGFYEHIHDAAGYAIVGAVPVTEAPPERLNMMWENRRLVPQEAPGESLGFSFERW